jgi:hypothetical protein
VLVIDNNNKPNVNMNTVVFTFQVSCPGIMADSVAESCTRGQVVKDVVTSAKTFVFKTNMNHANVKSIADSFNMGQDNAYADMAEAAEHRVDIRCPTEHNFICTATFNGRRIPLA